MFCTLPAKGLRKRTLNQFKGMPEIYHECIRVFGVPKATLSHTDRQRWEDDVGGQHIPLNIVFTRAHV